MCKEIDKKKLCFHVLHHGTLFQYMLTSDKKTLSENSLGDESTQQQDRSIDPAKHHWNDQWDKVARELMRGLPTLMELLKQLVKKPAKKAPLIIILASQLLKSCHQHMGLVQRAVSIMLYGNGAAKQVSIMYIAIIYFTTSMFIRKGLCKSSALACLHVTSEVTRTGEMH